MEQSPREAGGGPAHRWTCAVRSHYPASRKQESNCLCRLASTGHAHRGRDGLRCGVMTRSTWSRTPSPCLKPQPLSV